MWCFRSGDQHGRALIRRRIRVRRERDCPTRSNGGQWFELPRRVRSRSDSGSLVLRPGGSAAHLQPGPPFVRRDALDVGGEAAAA